MDLREVLEQVRWWRRRRRRSRFHSDDGGNSPDRKLLKQADEKGSKAELSS